MKKFLLLCTFVLATCVFSKAQVASYPFAQAMDTFVNITGTTVDVANEDDAYHANLPIGFSFVYNGVATTKFGVCTNGFITMDSLVHNGFQYMMGTSLSNDICVALADLYNTNTGGSIQYVTLGVAPNRVLVVQWKDYGIFGLQYCHLNFQIRLIEGSNCIQMYYGYNGVSGNNSTFNVGLIGATSADYNLRNTTNDWTQTAPPATFPGTGMHIGPLSTLPSGLVYAFGVCPATGIQFSYLFGKVYNDVNNNGTADAGELGLPNALIHESLQNINTVTNANGDYAFFFLDSTHTYTISCTPYQYWNISNTPATHAVTPLTQSTSGNDFGMYATPGVHDVTITSWASNVPWPKANVNFYATYHNVGTVVESDTITFTKDSLFTFTSATPTPSFMNGNKIGWLYSSLQLGEYRNIHLTLKADSMIVLGDTMNSSWMIQPYAGDVAQSNNTYHHHQACLSSWDPNEKTVSPDGQILNTQELEYTIRFQNTGTFMASNIFVKDTLDANLDINTFEVIGFSHLMTYTINGAGNIAFTFANINLPDSATNQAGSHGFVRYKIKPRVGLSVGSTINNTAGIYFDFNTPVATNTTHNIIKSATTPNGISTASASNNLLIIYPNPAEDKLTVSGNSLIGNTIHIYDVLGREYAIAPIQKGAGKFEINISTLNNGVYMVKATTATNQTYTARLIKVGK